MGSTVTGHPGIEAPSNTPKIYTNDELFALLSAPGSRKLRCEFCTSEFSLPRDLRCHICPRGGQQQSSRCQFCNLACHYKDELLMHIRFHHEKLIKKPKPIFPCPQCDQTFNNKTTLSKHRSDDHPTVYTCTVCGKRLRSQKFLECHMEVHKSPESRRSRLFSCSRCLENFSSKQSVLRHLQKLHGRLAKRRAICVRCGDDFIYSPTSRVVKFNRNLCDKCDSAAEHQQTTPASVALLPVKTEPEEVEVVKEKLVDVVVTTPPVKSEPEEESVNETIDNSFAAESSLPVFDAAATVTPSPLIWRPYNCRICSEAFGDSLVFRNHLKSHSATESVSETTSGAADICGVCAMQFKSRRYLYRHIDRGSCGPFVCQQCRLICESRTEYVIHHQRHGVEICPATFKCSGCQLVYVHKRNLERHLEKGCSRFRCRKCRIRLKDWGDYSRHREKVHKILLKGHCTTCGQRFESGAELSSHFKSCSNRG